MGDDCASTSPVIPHPPFHLHELPTLLLLPLGECATAVAMAASSCEKKNLKIPKKNFILYSVYIKVYKKLIFCLKKEILYFEYFPAFKINKSHCSSEFLIFLFLNKIFVINAGIEPAFSVKFGNRTRI